MKRSFVRRLLIAGIVVLVMLIGAVFLISRIDRSEPLTAVQQVLKPGAVELSAETKLDRTIYVDYLRTHALSPIDYVVEKYRTHDVVMLGEAHQIREDCELVCGLIEPLYRRAGVKTLAMELIKQGRTKEINRLLTAPVYDEQRVIQIFREDYFYWGFEEYMDILKAVWAFNRTLAPGEDQFRVIGFQPDMDIYRVDCGSLFQKVMEFPRLLRMEELYARPVLDMTRGKKTKVLVQVGLFHSFLNYRQPKVVDGKMYGEFARVRMGQLLKRELGDRVFQIDLHVRHDGAVHYVGKPTEPVMCFLENLYAENGSVPIGFDVHDSPFAMLRDTCSWFSKYQKYVTLSDIAQGYIMQASLEGLHTVKWVDGFVVPSNFHMLRTYALQRGLISQGEGKSPDELDRKLASLLREGVRFP